MLVAEQVTAIEKPAAAEFNSEPMNVFLLGATPSIVPNKHDDPVAKLKKTGGNTGNQIIAHALLGQIEYRDLSWDYSLHPHAVRERFDTFVIAAANFLFPSFDFGGMADYIEKSDLPVAIVGLGAQSNTYETDIKLLPGTERFLKVISDRAVTIGVRGPFTQEVLHQRGIDNVTVTGCPSYYIHALPSLGLFKREFDQVRKISVNASRDVIAHSFDAEKMSRIVRELYRCAIEHDADFIAQSEHPEIMLAGNGPAACADQALISIASFLKGDVGDAAVRAWAPGHVRAFFNVNDWIQAIRGYDFVFGNRFHGNMLAVQHGVPACVICHDTRTEEMCRFTGLPHVSIVDLDRIDVRDLYDRVDCTTLNRRYETLLPQYRHFLQRNNLQLKSENRSL